jgi:hypothetical protein
MFAGHSHTKSVKEEARIGNKISVTMDGHMFFLIPSLPKIRG